MHKPIEDQIFEAEEIRRSQNKPDGKPVPPVAPPKRELKPGDNIPKSPER